MKAIELSNNLKQILAKKYWHQDGSMPGYSIIMACDNLEYLCGLHAMGVPDVKQLIAGIKKYGKIEVWIDEE